MDSLEVLFQERDNANAALSVASDRVERFQLIRAVLLLVFAGLMLNHTFVKPELETLKTQYSSWRSDYITKKDWLSPMKARNIVLNTEAKRAAVKSLPEFVAIRGTLEGKVDCSVLYKTLVEKTYHFPPITINALRKTLVDFQAKHGKKPISELKAEIFIHSGPFVFHERKTSRFEELELLALRIPAVTFDAKDSEVTSVAIDRVIKQIDDIRSTWGDTIAKWEAIQEGVPHWSDWSLSAFELHTDAAATKCNAVLEQLTAYQLDGLTIADKSLGELVKAIDDSLKKEQEKVEVEKDRASVLSVPIAIPKWQITLLFPLLFVLSVCALDMLRTNRTLLAIRVAKLNAELRSASGRQSIGGFGNEVLNSTGAFEYMQTGRWAPLFDNSPHLFSAIFYVIATYAMAAYLLWRWALLLFSDMFVSLPWWSRGWAITALVGTVALSLALIWISRRISAAVLAAARATPSQDQQCDSAHRQR